MSVYNVQSVHRHVYERVYVCSCAKVETRKERRQKCCVYTHIKNCRGLPIRLFCFAKIVYLLNRLPTIVQNIINRRAF